MSERAPTQVMGLALGQRSPSQPLVIERDDGHTSVADLGWWLRQRRASPPEDIGVLDLVRAGRCLDVGCATGRHLDFLRDRRVPGRGIDTCRRAVELATAQGHACQVADVWNYAPATRYSTVLALGGNLGIAGTLDRLTPYLVRLGDLTAGAGSVIVSSVDWRLTASDHPRHRAHLTRQRQAGRYPGEVLLRLRFEAVTSAWFPWIWVDPDTLADAAERAGLAITQQLRWEGKYAAELRHKAL